MNAEEFIRRFLQHVLPARFVKVRYYGLLSPRNRQLLERAREMLRPGAIHVTTSAHAETDAEKVNDAVDSLLCLKCGGVLTKRRRLVATQLPAAGSRPP